MAIKLPQPKNFDDDVEIEKKVETVEVPTPSGATMSLLNEDEAKFYKNISAQYKEHNKFSNISDLLELDRILNMEVMCYRWSTWILQEEDYDGNPIPPELQRNVKEWSKEIRDTKAGLGIDKKTREAGKGESPAEYVEKLIYRAGQFGVHRNNQVIKAHTLWKELEGKITLYKNSTNTERTEFKCHIEDILEWLDEKFKEFDKIDEVFREEQRIWLRRDLND